MLPFLCVCESVYVWVFVCVFFVLQGVCALYTSATLGKFNRCALQYNSSSRSEGISKAARVLEPPCGYWDAGKQHAFMQLTTNISASSSISEKKSQRMIANYPLTPQMHQAEHTHTILKYFICSAAL